jgi:hypothetical protein
VANPEGNSGRLNLTAKERNVEAWELQRVSRSPLWDVLRGHSYIWHRTSLLSLAAIIGDGAIVPNTGQLTPAFPQSVGSYSRHCAGVSIFDFDTSSEESIREFEDAWESVLIKDQSVLICVRRDSLRRDKLVLPTEIKWNAENVLTVIPKVEAIYCGSIPVSSFCGFVLAEFKYGGGVSWHKLEPSSDPLVELPRLAETWNLNRRRLKMEREARGENSLGDLVAESLHMSASRQTE